MSKKSHKGKNEASQEESKAVDVAEVATEDTDLGQSAEKPQEESKAVVHGEIVAQKFYTITDVLCNGVFLNAGQEVTDANLLATLKNDKLVTTEKL